MAFIFLRRTNKETVRHKFAQTRYVRDTFCYFCVWFGRENVLSFVSPVSV
jgi:hypothetical protein